MNSLQRGAKPWISGSGDRDCCSFHNSGLDRTPHDRGFDRVLCKVGIRRVLFPAVHHRDRHHRCVRLATVCQFPDDRDTPAQTAEVSTPTPTSVADPAHRSGITTPTVNVATAIPRHKSVPCVPSPLTSSSVS